jgi:hypothetical protein
MGWVVSVTPGRALSQRRTSVTHWTGGWVGLSWSGHKRLEEESFAFGGDRIPVFQTVVRHYIDWATLVWTATCQKWKVFENCWVGLLLEIKYADEKDTTAPVCIHFMHSVQRTYKNEWLIRTLSVICLASISSILLNLSPHLSWQVTMVTISTWTKETVVRPNQYVQPPHC